MNIMYNYSDRVALSMPIWFMHLLITCWVQGSGTGKMFKGHTNRFFAGAEKALFDTPIAWATYKRSCMPFIIIQRQEKYYEAFRLTLPLQKEKVSTTN